MQCVIDTYLTRRLSHGTGWATLSTAALQHFKDGNLNNSSLVTICRNAEKLSCLCANFLNERPFCLVHATTGSCDDPKQDTIKHVCVHAAVQLSLCLSTVLNPFTYALKPGALVANHIRVLSKKACTKCVHELKRAQLHAASMLAAMKLSKAKVQCVMAVHRQFQRATVKPACCNYTWQGAVGWTLLKTGLRML
eukprot:6187872-Pleurochrysis_carterae.AAC.1